MCYHCETSQGKYKNRVTCCRGCCCCLGALFVIGLGFGAALLVVFLPSIFETLTLNDEYKALTSNVRDVRATTLNNQCTNYDKLRDAYQGKMVWRCLDSECIPIAYRCNGYYDCADKSDETDCMEFCDEAEKKDLRWSCSAQVQITAQDTEYGPAYPLCLHPSFYCDGWIDCPDDDQHDEMNCPEGSTVFRRRNETVTCSPSNNFICGDLEICMSSELVCDGYSQCLDGSDESSCE